MDDIESYDLMCSEFVGRTGKTPTHLFLSKEQHDAISKSFGKEDVSVKALCLHDAAYVEIFVVNFSLGAKPSVPKFVYMEE